jgi:hypothetical protein
MENSNYYFEELKQSVVNLCDCFQEGERVNIQILIIYIGNLCDCFKNFCLTYKISNINKFNDFKQSIVNLCDYFEAGKKPFNDEIVYYVSNVCDKFYDYFSAINSLEVIN